MNCHEETVLGIARITRHLATRQPGERVDLKTLWSVARGGPDEPQFSDNAEALLLEWIKDGVASMNDDAVEKVMRGDFSDLWLTVNFYMKRYFGLTPVEPTALVVED